MGTEETIGTTNNEENYKNNIKMHWLNKVQINIKEKINQFFFELTTYKQEIKSEDLKNWEKNIISEIKTELNNLIELLVKNKDIVIIDTIIDKKEYKIEDISELNIFNPKDIEKENKEITRKFQSESFNFTSDNESVENENIAMLFKKAAKISRCAFIKGRKQLYKIMRKKYFEMEGKEISLDDENSKNEFSCWVKSFEKENDIKLYEIYLSQINLFENDKNDNEQRFLSQLYYDLSIMYFHCGLSFPNVEINFDKEDDFNSDTMIDFVNRGKNRKVNFVILPSLFWNGNFLQNGKSFVFTFYKNTFRFDQSINDSLNKILYQE